MNDHAVPSTPVGANDWVRAIRSDPSVTRMTLATALLLASYSDPDGTNVRPTVARLGTELGLAVTDGRCSSVSEYLSTLRGLGWIEELRAGGGRKASEYRLTAPLPVESSENRAPTSTVVVPNRPGDGTVSTDNRPGDRTVVVPNRPGDRTAPVRDVGRHPSGRQDPTSTRPLQDQQQQAAAEVPATASDDPAERAARTLAGRLDVSDADALDAVRDVIARHRPDNPTAYMRGFTAADVQERAEQYRRTTEATQQAAARQRARDADTCPHGTYRGAHVDRSGQSRICGDCEADNPAEVPA